MIDIENEVFDTVATRARAKHPKLYMTGEAVKKPPSLPCGVLYEIDNQIYRKSRDSVSVENHAEVMYQAETYSNKAKAKKAECRAIMATIDEAMAALGFTRTMLNIVPNEDTSICRLVARYKAIVSKDKTIYRR